MVRSKSGGNAPVEVGSLSYYLQGFIHPKVVVWDISEPSTIWLSTKESCVRKLYEVFHPTGPLMPGGDHLESMDDSQPLLPNKNQSELLSFDRGEFWVRACATRTKLDSCQPEISEV